MAAVVMTVSLSFLSFEAWAQSINSWEAYTSKNAVRDIIEDGAGKKWMITDGGMFRWTEQDSIDATWTVLDGMHRLDPTTFIYHEDSNRFFIGYLDGIIDVYDPEEDQFSTLADISRADQFNSRSINDFEITADSLVVSTDFGIVIYNLNSLLVSDSFSKFGRMNSAVKVYDLTLQGGKIYAATETGVAVGAVNTSLSEPDNWTVYDENNGFVSDPVTQITHYNERIWASTAAGNWQHQQDSGWAETSMFGNTGIVDFYSGAGDGKLYAISADRYYVVTQNSVESSGNILSERQAQSILASQSNSKHIWIGTASSGLLHYNLSNNEVTSILPDGPYSNFFNNIEISGRMLAASSATAFPQVSPLNRFKGFYTFDLENQRWSSFNQQTNQALRQFGFSLGFSTTVTDNHVYSGSWGNGVVRLSRESGGIEHFNANNSVIRGIESSESYIVASGLDTDRDQGVWLTSYLAQLPLYYQPPESDTWTAFPKASSVQSSDHYFDIFVDSYGQKWISLRSVDNNGRGLLVINTGDPDDSSDDRSVKLTEDFDNGNLPNGFVNDITEDRNGEVWIATARGVARFILPEFVVDGSSIDRRAQWLINADTTSENPYLLRDVNATSLVVNGANEKWIGTEGDGIWLLDQEGGRVLEHFTVENSPLISNNIISMAIDPPTGTLFIATDLGMVSYTGTSKAPVSEMNDLFIYPNPFSYSSNPDGVIIEDLSESTTIRVMAIDGTLVNKLEAQGGRVRWDGRDFQGSQVATGVYLIVALDREQGQKAVGKIVITR